MIHGKASLGDLIALFVRVQSVGRELGLAAPFNLLKMGDYVLGYTRAHQAAPIQFIVQWRSAHLVQAMQWVGPPGLPEKLLRMLTEELEYLRQVESSKRRM